ncbi:MAG TPA: SDR family oxidoreductase [Ktedonobacteraceae bacterium]|nr:SDR family oxidoreductase [Ktedonobacteraceae bacterium]
MNNHEPRNYIITGASGLLGKHVVNVLAEHGERLFLVGRTKQRLEELQSVAPSRISIYSGDLNDPSVAQEAVSTAIKHFGNIHGLVHLIGQIVRGPIQTTPAAQYRAAFDANFLTAVNITQPLLSQLAPDASLVYMSSFLAHDPVQEMSAYAASKAALVTWAKALAREICSYARANVVSTTILDDQHWRSRMGTKVNECLISPVEIAEMIAHLLSPQTRSLNGAIIPIYGKFCLEDTTFTCLPGQNDDITERER